LSKDAVLRVKNAVITNPFHRLLVHDTPDEPFAILLCPKDEEFADLNRVRRESRKLLAQTQGKRV
jgi:hypothetical protein